MGIRVAPLEPLGKDEADEKHTTGGEHIDALGEADHDTGGDNGGNSIAAVTLVDETAGGGKLDAIAAATPVDEPVAAVPAAETAPSPAGVTKVTPLDCTPLDLLALDRQVLEKLHNDTGGDDDLWDRRKKAAFLNGEMDEIAEWMVGDVAQWPGVSVDNGRVTELKLEEFGLNGALPVELGSLTGLKLLSLRSNRIGGAVPASLGNLTNLTELDLCNNKLEGPMPAELGNLTSLQKLDLGSNQLSGLLTAAIGSLARLTGLKELDLFNNKLSGAIPSEIGSLTSLEKLHLGNNLITGACRVRVPPVARRPPLTRTRCRYHLL